MTPDILAALQASLSAHWTAQLFYQSAGTHLIRWQFLKLGAHLIAEAEDERQHSAVLMTRLEFWDQQPAFEHTSPSWPAHDPIGILKAALDLEQSAVVLERAGYATALAGGDPGTATVFADLLAGSEESIERLTGQLAEVVRLIGPDNFLANQT